MIEKKKTEKKTISTYDIVYVALSVALITVCAWITIPMDIPFTMQTFAVFFVTACFGVWKSTSAVLAYLLLGMIGVPVFANFRGGMDALFGVTGGYLIGFIFFALITGFLIKIMGRSLTALIVAMVAGLAACYLFGSIWFMILYIKGGKEIGFVAILLKCVVPYLIPDGVKIVLAAIVSQRIQKANIIKD